MLETHTLTVLVCYIEETGKNHVHIHEIIVRAFDSIASPTQVILRHKADVTSKYKTLRKRQGFKKQTVEEFQNKQRIRKSINVEQNPTLSR